MINVDLKECCYKCEYSNIEIKETTLSSLMENSSIKNVHIFCNNENVCKFIEQEGCNNE